MKPVKLRDAVAFDQEVLTPDGYGGQDRAWAEVYACRALFKYQNGAEAVDAGALTGSAVFKVRVRSCALARAITAAHRLRDTRRGVAYNIREVDVVSDPSWVWFEVENGVAI